MWRWSCLFSLCGLLLGLSNAAPFDRSTGSSAFAPQHYEQVVVLRTRSDSEVFPLPCGADRCQVIDLEDGVCGRGSADVVVLTGHSVPPHHYLQSSPDELARALVCLQPKVIVLDTCYGFSAPLLLHLAALGSTAVIIGSLGKLPPAGLRYEPTFFAPNAKMEDRVAAVSTRSGAPLQRWQVDTHELAAAVATLQGWTAKQLNEHVARRHPDLLRVPLGSDQVVLMPPELRR